MSSFGKFGADSISAQVDSTSSSSSGDGFYHAARGAAVDMTDDQAIKGFDAERMRARTYLTAAEEKKLIRRIDWHLMPLCSIMFLFKNLDVDNVDASLYNPLWLSADMWIQVSNARIMNKGTPDNILTQLNITSDQFALVTVLYYVSVTLLMIGTLRCTYLNLIDSLHCLRSSF